MSNPTILVVEDDDAVRRGVVDTMKFAGYQVLAAPDGRTGRQAALTATYDLLLLDLVLPHYTGFDILEALQAERPGQAVIILSAKGEENDRVQGLKMGADDYVMKPFSARELLARVDAVLRRTTERQALGQRYEILGRVIDLTQSQIEYDGKQSELSEREVGVLRYLIGNPERPVPRDELLRHVWGIDPSRIETRTVDMHIAHLRKKLSDGEQTILKTIRGTGLSTRDELMNRPWVIWFVLGACATVILGMFSWMTVHALGSERERLEMETQAQIAERMRLSLARMDTVGTELLVVENQRPPFHYEPFYSPENVMTNTLQAVAKGVVLQPSPLLLAERDLVKMHFEVNAQGEFRSPQLPLGNQREMAIQAGVDEKALMHAGEKMAEVQKMFPEHLRLASMLCVAAENSPWGDSAPIQKIQDEANEWMLANANTVQQEEQQVYQTNLNNREKQGRAVVLQKAVGKATKRSSDEALNYVNPGPLEQIVSVAPLLPVWVGEEILLIREVKMSRSIKYQGVWLDREKVEAEFLAQIPEDLICAQLVAVKSGMAQFNDPMALASLPWKLSQGPLDELVLERMTPLRATLVAGWIAALLALVALYLLLRGVMKLSERRAAFVSSVTHELRTPLTTFRLYSEMLADGMVTEEVQREEYLRTMLSESERLNHLVENVLAYSRIERGNARSKQQLVSVESLVEQLRPVLQRRVDQEGVALSIEVDENAGVYTSVITNRRGAAPSLIKHHLARGGAENYIEEFKNNISARLLPSQNFVANYTWLVIAQLAYNLGQWFKLLVLPTSSHSHQFKRLRLHWFCVAARVIHSGRQTKIALARAGGTATRFARAQATIRLL